MPSTNEELRVQIARTGRPLTPNETAKLADAQTAAASQVAKEYAVQSELSALDRLLARIPTLVKVISDIGDTVITVSRALLIALLPVVLMLAMVVEQQRVMHGLALFETDSALAAGGAWLLVISNLLIELVIQYTYQREGYTPKRAKRRSLRLVWREILYFLGAGRGWTAESHSPAYRYELVLKAITTAILFLAVGGSMTAVLQSVSGNYWQGLIAITTASTLLEMITWVSGLIFAVVVVKVAQSLTAYVSIRAVEFAIEIGYRTGSKAAIADAHEATREAVEREHLVAALSRRGVTVGENERPEWQNGRANLQIRKKCTNCGESFVTRQQHITLCPACRK